MTTPQEWAERIAASEQKIVNIAFGWATATTKEMKADALDRLYGEVRAHHRMLSKAKDERPTMACEISQVRAEGGPR